MWLCNTTQVRLSCGARNRGASREHFEVEAARRNRATRLGHRLLTPNNEASPSSASTWRCAMLQRRLRRPQLL